jgi:hypothetical protein
VAHRTGRLATLAAAAARAMSAKPLLSGKGQGWLFRDTT